jgi:preprotein translocase subunit YajC
LASLIVIIAMFALLWLLLIRPQRAKQQQHDRMVENVDIGDEVLSSGGIYGLVRGVDDDANELHVEIAPGIEVRMDRRAVGAIVTKDESEVDDEVAEEPEEPEEPAALAEDEGVVNSLDERAATETVEPNRR